MNLQTARLIGSKTVAILRQRVFPCAGIRPYLID